MAVKQADLDAWAMRALHVNGCLLEALTALDKGDIAAVRQWAQLARTENWETEKAMVAAGAACPIQARADMIELPEEDRPLPIKPEGYDLAALVVEGGGKGAGE